MKDNNPLIKVDHLVKQFGDTKALNDVSAEIRHGEVVVVVGPSGSGKSTFFAVLTYLKNLQMVRYSLRVQTLQTLRQISTLIDKKWVWFSSSLTSFHI